MQRYGARFMEIKARYVLIGLFTLASIVAGFAFVYWLETTGGLGKRTSYEVRFHNTVSGLLTAPRCFSTASEWAK